MRRAIRAGIVVGLGLALAGVPSGVGLAQEEAETARTPPAPEVKDARNTTAGAVYEVSDPCEDIAPGAASMEPEQAIEEDPGTNAHREWVESIWNMP